MINVCYSLMTTYRNKAYVFSSLLVGLGASMVAYFLLFSLPVLWDHFKVWCVGYGAFWWDCDWIIKIIHVTHRWMPCLLLRGAGIDSWDFWLLFQVRGQQLSFV